MKNIVLVFMIVFLASCESGIFSNKSLNISKLFKGSADYSEHPILGRWTYDLKGCEETYEFLADGTRHGFSHEEVMESSYEISHQPLETGFYSFSDTVTRDNGGQDCRGETDNMVGDVVNVFIRFHPSLSAFYICIDQSMHECFGPFEKEAGL